MAELIRFNDVTLGYQGRPVLAGLNFAIHEGEFFGIVGANGSGKTTILRALLGVIKPMRGTIMVHVPSKDSRNAPAEGGTPGLTVRPGVLKLGYVPQRGVLDEIYPLSAREIVLMGRYGALGLLAWPGQRDRELVDQALAHVGLLEVAGRPFRDLSGGQKQRVLIARALASQARVLVLDEPTDGMDLEGQAGIVGLIKRLQTDHRVSVVYVTHRLNELASAAERLLLLHDGKVQVGPVEEILTAPVLSAVYGMPVRVEQFDGKRVVLS